MIKTRRFIFFLFIVGFSFLFVACNGDKTTGNTTIDTSQDTEAPVITLNQDEIILEINNTLNVNNYVTVTDNVSSSENITITVSDWGSFDQSIEGEYTIEITAEDEAGNSTKATVTVIVRIDVLPPMLTGSVAPVSHLAGEEVDLTKGLTGVDNVDGTNVTFTVSDYKDYVATVPGTYTIEITISDQAGNKSNPIERTIVVSESYARAEMTSFAGDIVRFKALYNPQVFNGNTGTGYNSAYNGEYVNVLSKDYLTWLTEYAPERLGSGVGWSIVAVTNSDNEIVYVRHWNSGEAYMADDELVSIMNTDWSTGSVRSWSEQINDTVIPRSNARYSSGEFGLMMANLLQWVPDGGHVFMFMNWATVGLNEENEIVTIANTADMARSMGANYIMNSDEDGDEIRDYALGRTLEILDAELSDESTRVSFDSDNPFPVITVPSKRYVNPTGIWKERYEQKVYLDKFTEENPFNPLDGIVANDGKGNDISDQVTYKIYRFQTAQAVYGIMPSVPLTDPLWAEVSDNPWQLSANEVQLADILNPVNDGANFVVAYQVTANGHTDVAYNIITISASSPDYVDLYGATDTVYAKAMGVEVRMEMNPELISFGAFDQAERGMIFTSEYYTALTEKPVLTKGVAVVLDKYYDIQTMRFLNGTPFEISKNKDLNTSGLLWDATNLLQGIIVPEDGYLLVYPEGLNGSIVNSAFKAFYDYDYNNEEVTTPNPTSGIVQVQLPIKEVQEVSTLIVNEQTAQVTVNGVEMNLEVITNNRKALVHDPSLGGAGFRSGAGKVYLYDKDMYAAFLQDPQVVDSFTNIASNLGVPWFNNGALMIFDESGNFVKARLGVGAAAEVNADGTFLFGNQITNWDVTVYNVDNEKVHGLLANVLDDVPDNGYFMIFPTTAATSAARNFAIDLVWNHNYPGGGAIVDVNADPAPAGADTLGFDATSFTSEYFSALNIDVNYVATIVDQPTKITKPSVTLSNNELVWNANTLAGSYNLYVDGVLFAENVGTLSEDGLTYTLDLSELSMDEGTFNLQLRAITANGEVSATSVLSTGVEFTVDRLDLPGNFNRTDNLLTWDAVDGATSYFVSINDGEFVEVTTNEIIIPDADIIDGVIVKVYATGSETLFDSLVVEYTLDVEVIPMEIAMGPYVVNVKEFIVSSWMRYVAAGDVGAQWIEGFVVVNNAEGFLNIADDTRVFAGGYAVLLDSNMQVKYIVDRWGHEWNATTGWTTNAEGWEYGANLYASYFKPYLAEGDTLVFASQFSTGLEEGNYRNILGNALIFDFGVVTQDHRNVVLADCIDPATVVIELREKIMTTSISVGNVDLPLVQFELDKWLNYIDPAGSNDIGAANIAGLILVNNAFGITLLDDTHKIFAGGYAAVLDSEMNVKYIVDRWGHEWNPTDGWTTYETNPWGYGANLYASYFKAHLAEGDMLLLASQYAKGLPTGTYRNYFGSALIKDLGSYSADHRAVDLATAVNPANVNLTIKETQTVLRIGNAVLNYKEFTLENWMSTYAVDDPGAASIPELVVISDLSTIANYADTDKVFSGGYAILVDENMNVKYIVDRWGNEWNATDGWTVNAGAWTYGANVFVSYFKDYVAAGDTLILGGQYEFGLTTGASYRDVIGNQIFFDLGTAIYSGDHRAVAVADAIDPTTVTIQIIELA